MICMQLKDILSFNLIVIGLLVAEIYVFIPKNKRESTVDTDQEYIYTDYVVPHFDADYEYILCDVVDISFCLLH